ncbi:hypothetical protein Goshw_009763 [Gossypium schwendimanii]|uniref:Uncharacterized protein n=1 Tax=Gossypium schwendimanii TaxID=34291 RepID=A0A7J9KWV5_GOSSC|nr:hypothetical protein [Gossypium schwendimanii]
MNWLRRNFGGLDEDSTEGQSEQHAQAYILMIIGGFLMPDKWNHRLCYMRLPDELRDMRLLLDQQSEVEAIAAHDLACYSEYMSWFRVHGMPYLLGEEAMGRPPHTRRLR